MPLGHSTLVRREALANRQGHASHLGGSGGYGFGGSRLGLKGSQHLQPPVGMKMAERCVSLDLVFNAPCSRNRRANEKSSI